MKDIFEGIDHIYHQYPNNSDIKDLAAAAMALASVIEGEAVPFSNVDMLSRAAYNALAHLANHTYAIKLPALSIQGGRK